MISYEAINWDKDTVCEICNDPIPLGELYYQVWFVPDWAAMCRSCYHRVKREGLIEEAKI